MAGAVFLEFIGFFIITALVLSRATSCAARSATPVEHRQAAAAARLQLKIVYKRSDISQSCDSPHALLVEQLMLGRWCSLLVGI